MCVTPDMDDEDDDVVCLGTPLEELDEGDVQTRKAQRVEDQVVTDKQGRRRFHGAFTGGFSAGYFNSVGTKEGWTPSTFVSSRAQRNEAKSSRPQDYMDEEDLEAFGISPQGIRTSADYDSSKQEKRKRVTDPSGPIPGTPVLEELLRPARETVGMKLLRHLGWRPGQGVGPRVSRRQKLSDKKEKRRMLASQGAAVKGGASDSEGGSDDSEDEAHKDITFAPSDVPELSMVQPKTDQFGLGYTPLSRASVLGGHVNLFDPAPLSLMEKKKKLLIKGQAFGVGAFEEDDEDIYATEDMSNYDFGEEKEAKDKKQGRQEQQNMVMLGLVKVLEGFKLASQPVEQPKAYPTPALPPDFIPIHKPRRLRFERRESELRGLGRHTMTAEQRAQAIAEKPKATVEVRSGVKGQNQHQQQASKDSQKTLDTSEVDKLFEEFQNSDKRLSSDYKPFARNPEKQKRYELFLRMKDKGQKDRYYLAQPKSMTEWEREREVQEFSRAAKLFQPLTSSMATRFVTAATNDADTSLKDGLNTDIPKAAAKEVKEGLLDPTEPGDERTAAARSGMFGKMTQTVEEWHPDNLLCRRFNVPNPFPDSSFVGVRKARKEKFSLFSNFHTDAKETAGLRSSHDRKEKDRQQEEEMEVQEGEEPQLQDKPEDYGLKVPIDGPPTMDLFKAIFQDSDSDSEEEKSDSSSPKRDEKAAHHSHPSSSSYSATPSDTSVTKSNTHEETRGSSREKSQSFWNTEAAPTTSSTPATAPHPRQHRGRPSRFAPLNEDVGSPAKEAQKPTNQPEDIHTHTFVPRKKDAPDNKNVSASFQGIFANVDLVALNSYRNQEPKEENKEVKRTWPESVTKLAQEMPKNDASPSSTDSEDAYGPPIPSHLKDRAQEIQSTPPATMIRPVGEVAARQQKVTGWVERETGSSKSSTKKHKHKARSKSKKEKKKKKDKKSKKHKEKKKKKERKSSSRRRRSNSSRSNSSGSETSSSDAD